MVQICENIWVRRIAGANKIGKWRMDEPREEALVNQGIKKKFVRIWLQLAKYVEHIDVDRLANKADALNTADKNDLDCDRKIVENRNNIRMILERNAEWEHKSAGSGNVVETAA